MERFGSRLSLAMLMLAVFVTACGAPKKKAEEDPVKDEPTTTEGSDELKREADRERLENERKNIIFERRVRQAEEYLRANQLKLAESAIADALNYRPTDEDALRLQARIQRALGDRPGTTDDLMGEVVERERVLREEQKVTIRAYLKRAKTSTDAREWDSAKRSYESALFIVNTSPHGLDAELEDLAGQARQGLKDLEAVQAREERDMARKNAEEALAEINRQQEQAMVAAQQRRARLLAAAVDAFNQENFRTAEDYARQVLAEEPDNRLAQDIVDNASKARHTFVGLSILRATKESFRDWIREIEESKVPQGQILKWPSQRFWDKITQLRARRSAASAGRSLSREEQNVLNQLRTRTVDLRFSKTQFPDVVSYLNAATGVNFVVDARAREDLSAAEVTLTVDRVTVEDGLALIMRQASPEGEAVYEVVGNVVRFIKKEDQEKNMVLQVHPVADLVLGLTDFIPGQITLVGVDDESEEPLFDSEAEEVPLPYGTIDELMELVRTSVEPAAWEEGNATMSSQGKNLVVFQTPDMQEKVARFLDDLRVFGGVVVTVQTRFLTVQDAFLRDVGVDFRGLGGQNGGPLAVLDDVTSGLDDAASAALDNSGPGLPAGAAQPPSSGFFFNDGADGDFRGRTENIFSSPLGNLLTSLGGGAFQATFIDDLALSVILRLTEKSARIRELTAPSLTVYNTQRANLTVVNQISFIQDFDVEVAQTAFIADPVIGVIQDGLTLDVRPTVSNDRTYVTLELRPTIADLQTPIQTFQTLLGAAIAFVSAQSPVTIQLPELNIRTAETTVKVPDGGSVLLGGLKDISTVDKKSTTPILGNLPILNFIFSRQGKSEEIEHIMIVVTATITDLQEQGAARRG